MNVNEEFEIYRSVKLHPYNVLNDKLSLNSTIILDSTMKFIDNRTAKEGRTPETSLNSYCQSRPSASNKH